MTDGVLRYVTASTSVYCMLTLTSAKNPVLKEIRKAVLRGSLTDGGLCVAESFHLLEEALRSDCEIDSVFATESVKSAVEAHVRGLKSIRVMVLADDLFRSIAATEHSQGVIALVRPPQWNLDQLFRGLALVVVLDGVQDPGTAGTIVRAAEAFGASGVAFLKGTVDPFNPKTVRASAGSVFRVPMVASLDERLLLAAIEQRKIDMYAMAPAGILPLESCRMARKCVLVIGSEGHGVSMHLRSKSIDVRIPTVGVESLNAAMAAAVALYEARRQRMAAEA